MFSLPADVVELLLGDGVLTLQQVVERVQGAHLKGLLLVVYLTPAPAAAIRALIHSTASIAHAESTIADCY